MVSTTSSPLAIPPAKMHLNALTGLRFFPALHVVLYHVARQQCEHSPAWIRNIVSSGYVGVSLFFVLSGFILAYSYLDASGAQRVDKRAFWAARIARIYPVYALGIAVMVPFYFSYLLQHFSLWRAILKGGAGTLLTLSLLQSWLPQTAGLINHPGWSLSTEAFFYFIFPFLAAIVQHRSAKQLLIWMGVLWLLSLIGPSLYWLLIGPGTSEVSNFLIGFLKFNPLIRLPEFIVGVLLGKVFRLRRQEKNHSQSTWHSFVALSVIFFTISQINFFPYILAHNCILVPPFAFLVYSLAFNQDWMSNFLSLSWVMVLGESSYALYIIHIPIYTIMTTLSSKMGFEYKNGIFLIIYFVCVLGSSLLVLQFFEKPARKFLRKLLMSPQRVSK